MKKVVCKKCGSISFEEKTARMEHIEDCIVWIVVLG